MASFADFSKFLMKRSTLMVVVFLVVIVGLYMYSDSKSFSMDRMTDKDGGSAVMATPNGGAATAHIATPQVIPDGYNNKEIANPSDLLPKDMNSEWAKLNPVNSGDRVIGGDLLDSTAFMGQVSQYKGIMNHDLRAWPVIPKQTVGPFLNSSYEQDVHNIGIKVA